jgi:hypothetical protein
MVSVPFSLLHLYRIVFVTIGIARVDADGDRVDDRLDSEIAQRILNRPALAVC